LYRFTKLTLDRVYSLDIQFSNSTTKIGSLLIVLILLLLAIGFTIFMQPEPIIKEVATPETAQVPVTQNLPEEVTPEGVKELISSNTPFLLVNAENYNPESHSAPGLTRLIYYTTTPSIRSAKKMTRQDRESNPTGFSDVIKQNSQRLIGTPIEWQRMGLIFSHNPIPMQPLKITPSQLSESIKDAVDLQIIDLRPVAPGLTDETPFPQALRWMPHEVLNNLPKLSKEKWTVLVGLSSEDEQPIAFELFQKGYVLTAVLEGGYPAWVSATGR